MATPHRTDTSISRSRRHGDAIGAAVGLAVLVVGMILVRNGSVSRPEESVFHALNDLPGALYPLVWPSQQLGSLAVGPLVVVVAMLARRYRLALAALVATMSKLVFERIVKATVSRERPGTSIGPDVHLRGDVPTTGESFVSGHAVLVAALAGIIAPYLPGRWRALLWAVVGLVMFGRVYVGAHNPLDVVCGAGLGIAIACVINLALGVPVKEAEND
ncbi:MAG: phosphatase PAP2 family protein [Actinomycetota bacterium]|nr:phosphatase PAP2 family protein [Actinomycetota bacterium]